MTRYRVPFNKHFNSDASDRPRAGALIIAASDAESAWEAAIDIRDRNYADGLTPTRGRRFWMGMIHATAIEEAPPHDP